MSTASFYTDRTHEPRARVLEDVPADVWRGLVGLINRRVADGSLAREFSVYGCNACPEAITSTDTRALDSALGTLIPELRKIADLMPDAELRHLSLRQLPPTPVALDVIDFIGRYVQEPFRTPHRERQHEHLEFDPHHSRTQGQRRFRDEVELIFARNGIAYTIGDDMKVTRLGPPEARPLLSDFAPNSGDTKLDELLRDAHTRFLSRIPQDRVIALEKLWDAFERLKTLENSADKKQSIRQLIAKAVSGSTFGSHLDSECAELTNIGNSFHIRHFEHNKQPLPAGETTVDYLFTRLAGLIAYLLRQTGRM